MGAFQSGEFYATKQENTHSTMILAQIDRCNRVISTFAAAENIEDAKLNHRTYVAGGQEGKAIALSVRVLLSLTRKVLPPEYYEHEKTQNLYANAFLPRDGKYEYLSENPQKQYEAIMRIMDFYDELLAALFSLEEFSDMKYTTQRKPSEWGNSDDEEDLFTA
jgi:hypothetical protein